MDDTFKIFVHRLRDGLEEKIKEELDPKFLEIHEAALAFQAPIYIEGTAAFVDSVLVIRLSIHTEALIPCVICNQDVPVKISIPNFYLTERLENIKGSVFNYKEALREGILLEIPYTAECNSGDCPERGNMAQYFTKNRPTE